MNYGIGTVVFKDWKITKEIGQGGFGSVYELEKKDYGVTVKSALKVVRVPHSPSEVKSALSEGMDINSVTTYFRGIVDELVKEIALMSSLKSHPGIVSYEDHEIIPHEDGIGWDILIRMELLTPLMDYQETHVMDEVMVLKMAKDITDLLVYCQKKGMIHRDIKPENIFVNEWGQFKLGDFGVARTIEKTGGGLSKKGTESYMAPEVYKGQPYGTSVDIYSLGQVLYRYMNRNRLPFLPQAPAPITYMDKENALVKRMNGQPIEPPANGSEEFKKVILKACEYRPEERYHSAEELLQALKNVVIRDNLFVEDTYETTQEEEKTELLQKMPEEEKTVILFQELQKEELEVLQRSQEEKKPQEQIVQKQAPQEQKSQAHKHDYVQPVKEEKKEEKIAVAKPVKKRNNKLIAGIVAVVCLVGVIIGIGGNTGKEPTTDQEYMQCWMNTVEKAVEGDAEFLGRPIKYLNVGAVTGLLDESKLYYSATEENNTVSIWVVEDNSFSLLFTSPFNENGKIQSMEAEDWGLAYGTLNSMIKFGDVGIKIGDPEDKVFAKLGITREMIEWFNKTYGANRTLKLKDKENATDASVYMSIEDDDIYIKIESTDNQNNKFKGLRITIKNGCVKSARVSQR